VERHGAMGVLLDTDMLTILEGPTIVVPGCEYAEGTGYEGHAFFEASSIRKHDDTYYFVYSSTVMHELCYATSADPFGPYTYGGVIVSNCDMHIDTYKPADMPMAYGGNNHGSIVEIQGQWYIFYHRHTNNTWYSRQACAEPITFLEDGSIPQVEITSCGLNGKPLEGRGTYPAYIACHLFTPDHHMYSGVPGQPHVMQLRTEPEDAPACVGDIRDGVTIGFKSFDFQDVQRLTLTVLGYMGGVFEVRTQWDGPVLGEIATQNVNIWTEFSADIALPNGVHPLYLTYRGATQTRHGIGCFLQAIRFD